MTDANTDTTDEKTDKTPVFDGDFDADRAKRLIANLRSDLDKARTDLKTATEALSAREDAEKSDLQKAQDRAAALEKDLATVKTEAARTRIAAKHGLPDDVLEFLTGDTEEEIEKRATALAKYAKKEPEEETEEVTVPGKPKARLVPGHTTDEATSGKFDPRAVADRIRSNQQ